MDKLWNISLANATSEKGTFEFIHHSTASVIEVIQIYENGSRDRLWFDYSTFDEFVEFIDSLKKPK